MQIEQLFLNNPLRNFNYLIACPESGDALAIDPLDADRCLEVATKNNWKITQILNTHEHHDHTGGNKALKAATQATILAHHQAIDKIPDVDRGLKQGDIVTVGKSVKLEVLDTPGHTLSHVCLLSETEPPALFCGDTLFNAGAGNCHGGGHPELLYQTFSRKLAKLHDNTLIYPGHDYIVNNLSFALDREPDNQVAIELLTQVQHQDPHNPLVTTLHQEKMVNPFFRLTSKTIIEKLKHSFPDLPEAPEPKDVFLALRKLRDQW